MRIITGTLKGRKIPVPDTGLLRPTSDRTKEGIFSALASRIFFENRTVLDLFAGSGNLGFEAISRGASSVIFVDSETDHLKHIEKLALSFGVEKQIQPVISTVEDYLDKTGKSFDIIFADPPYDYYAIKDLPDIILKNGWLQNDGLLVLEHDKRVQFSEHKKCIYSKAYGRTIVSIFQADTVD
ncbi:MAG: 16S rRNA (guanine(966)-N(2))-methyltransferase RsmD [Balneolaceae bacterium]